MYTQFFNLREPPFTIAPNPRYLYMSAQHREALAHLLYGIGEEGGGFVALTGEVGTGKTTLCRCLLEQLPENVDVALIFNPQLNAEELLASICDELHIAYPQPLSLKLLSDALNRYLLAAHAGGRRTVVLIDEAQNLSYEVLEQVRLLTNLETSQTKLLQVILVGQPELQRLLQQPHMRQLAQRITARYHLQPLVLAETRAYVQHRLAVSGCQTPLFTKRAVARVHRLAGGIPRLINLICDRALLGAYGMGKHRVSSATVAKAAQEVLPPRPARSWRRAGLALAASLAALWLGLWWQRGAPGLDSLAALTGMPVPTGTPLPAPPKPAAEAQPAAATAPQPSPSPASPPTGDTATAAAADAPETPSKWAWLLEPWGRHTPAADVEPCGHADTPGLSCGQAPTQPQAATPEAAPTPAPAPETIAAPAASVVEAAVEAKPAEPPAAPREEAQRPAPPPAAARLAVPGVHDAEWLLAQPAGAYTLRIMSAREAASVGTLLQRYPNLAGQVYAQTSRGGGNALHSVYYGVFASADEAQRAAALLPPALGTPVLKTLRAVQQELRGSQRSAGP